MNDVGDAVRRMAMKDDDRTTQIRRLNDRFRRTGLGGKVLVTHGINDQGREFLAKCVRQMQLYDAFDESNDPYNEHDFGQMNIDGQKVFWKIDYYDHSMERGSPDPSDIERTTRVLTIMLAHEY